MTDSQDPSIDKKGAELNQQRYQMLEDIAKEMSSEVVFPTSFDSVSKLRKALSDPDVSLQKIAALLATEPLISVRILAIANSVTYNPNGDRIHDIQRAVERLGLNNVRTTALAVAMKQLLLARNVVAFAKVSSQLWGHSLRSASAAYVVARRLTKINPDEALLAGLIHDIGAFYMIYRGAQYPELVVRPDTLRHLVMHWHESIGHSLVIALGLPMEVADSIIDHDQPRLIPDPPKTLSDVVFIANMLAGGKFEWLDMPADQVAAAEEQIGAMGANLMEEINLHEQELLKSFA